MNALRLPTIVGASSADGLRISTGEEGTLCYGPYVPLEAGPYVAGFYIRRIGSPGSGSILLDIFENGLPIVAEKGFSDHRLFDDLASFVYLPFQLANATSHTEVRLHVEAGVLIELGDFVLFKADQRLWSST
jgi:hypothetical protein